jgi:DNA-binding PadR family transcriptional regulator
MNHTLSWAPDFHPVRERVQHVLRMSRERGERSRREHHRERDAYADRAEHREWRDRRSRRGRHVGRGDVYAATLLLLEERPLHGYEIIQLTTERSDGQWRPSAGSIYPALQLLEDQGYIEGEQQEHRRVFHLTEAGHAYINEHRAELVAARDAATARLDQGDTELMEMFQHLETAFRQVVQVGTAAQLAAAKELLIEVRRQLYRILADDTTTTT